MKAASVLLLAAILAACAAPGPREPDRYYVLDAGLATAAKPRAGVRVVVAPTTSAAFYDTQDIAFSRAPGERAYYQFNRWAERPPQAIQALLAARFEGTGPGGGLRLATHVDEIYHDASSQPGTVHLTLTARLEDAASRAVLARRTFTRTASAAAYDAAGAVRGFNEALAALLGDIETWVDAESKRPR